jgi:NADPH-dependent F420 reductase
MTTVGFVGGTGPEGLGLAMRMALAGYTVRIGSRRIDRAEQAATAVREAVGAAAVMPASRPDSAGALNADVCVESDLVVVVVPFEAHAATCADLAEAIGDKLVIDVAVPLIFRDGRPGVEAVPEGSATEQAQALLPAATVIGAFHNLSAKRLQDLCQPMEGDVFVTGDDAGAKQTVLDLVDELTALRGVDAGPLAMSKFVEDLTVLILGINQRYKATAAIQLVGPLVGLR